MGNSNNSFQWTYTDPSLIFPIDYSSDEYKAKYRQDPRNFRKYVLRSSLFEDILRSLTLTLDKKYMPPIPLEAVTFLDCFYKVAQKSEYSNIVFDMEPNLSNIMQEFWTDLCAELYNETSPTQDNGKPDSKIFYRHVLFQNKEFISSLLTPIWEKEVQQRLEKIKELVGQVDPNEQIQALRDCLMSLDRISLNLQLKTQSRRTSAAKTAPAGARPQQNPMQDLLISLLRFRREYMPSQEAERAYTLPNIKIYDGTTLEDAFKRIRRRGKGANKTMPLLLAARQAYLSHLAKLVETEETLKFEQQYTRLLNYLETSSFYRPNDLQNKIRESCKCYCQQLIDYCTFSPNPGTPFTPYPTPDIYTDDLIDCLIYEYMRQALNNFQGTIRAVIYYIGGRDIVTNDSIYQVSVAQSPASPIHETVLSYLTNYETHIEENTLELARTMLPNIPNPFLTQIFAFYPFFQQACEFLYGNQPHLFSNGVSYCQNYNIDNKIFWKMTKIAAEFFSRESPFSSQSEVSESFDLFDKILSNPHHQFSPTDFWNSFPKIIHAFLLQILKKVVDDNAPRLFDYIKPLLEPTQEHTS